MSNKIKGWKRNKKYNEYTEERRKGIRRNNRIRLTSFLALETEYKNTRLSRHGQYSIVNCVHCISTQPAVRLRSHDAVSNT
jgi:hypothetical protein